MKRTISFFLLLLLLLPTMAQKPFTMRVVAGKDYPYYIVNVEACIYETVFEREKWLSIRKNIYLDKLDSRTCTLTYDVKKNGKVDFNLTTIDQQGKKRQFYCLFPVPTIPGEQLTITLHDAWNFEIGGSLLYREYGKAYHAILHKEESFKDYFAKHCNEPGFALFVLAESILSVDGPRGTKFERYKLFDPETVSFLGDPEDPSTLWYITCQSFHSDEHIMKDFYDVRKQDKKIEVFDRQLEGQALIDAIGQKYKGKPTLVTVWTYEATNTTPDGYELYMHAKDMNMIHLTSISDTNESGEYQWKKGITVYPGEHYLLTRYQVDSLFHHYMPGIEYRRQGRYFYILLDAEGKVVDYGDRRHNYRQLIAQTDQLKAKAGLPPFKGKPYELKYLDLNVAEQKDLEKNEIFQQAKMRMSYTNSLPIEGHKSALYLANLLYTAKGEQLNISKRLYNAVVQFIDKQNKNNFERSLKQSIVLEARRARQEDDYQPDLEKYRQEMTVGKPVDLGLSVKWADMNVGARAAEETGMYFTWGDNEPIKDTNFGCDWSRYRWCKGSETTLRKYNTKAENGAVDMRTTMLPEDDAATIYWQGDWRTPSLKEMNELKEKCQWEWTAQNGHNGYKVTGPNGNSIFIPASGCLNYQGFYSVENTGYYWTSNISPDSPTDAYYLAFTQEGVNSKSLNERFDGRCIRPVCK